MRNLLVEKKHTKPYFFSISCSQTKTLKGVDNSLSVDTNLPRLKDTSWWRVDVKEMVEDIKSWGDCPFYLPSKKNRIHRLSDWDLKFFRRVNIDINDVSIDIKPLAKEYIKGKFNMDLEKELISALNHQRYPTQQEQKDFARYVELLEKIEELEFHLKGKKRNGYSYSNKPVDFTHKLFEFGKKEYNQKLKEVEKELKSLCKKNPILNEINFKYKYEELIKQPTFDEWKEENEWEVNNTWDEMDEDEQKQEECKDVSEFLDKQYEWYCENTHFDELLKE
jgi:hypothetical protein